jgi:ferrous iron transport protein A
LTVRCGLGYSEIEFRFQQRDLADADMSRAEVPTPSAPGAVPLASLRPGDCGLVESVDASTAVGRRLADLGFLPRTPVRVLRTAPLGDPIVYELRGYRLCMRRSEAARVLVVPVDLRPAAGP